MNPKEAMSAAINALNLKPIEQHPRANELIGLKQLHKMNITALHAIQDAEISITKAKAIAMSAVAETGVRLETLEIEMKLRAPDDDVDSLEVAVTREDAEADHGDMMRKQSQEGAA